MNILKIHVPIFLYNERQSCNMAQKFWLRYVKKTMEESVTRYYLNSMEVEILKPAFIYIYTKNLSGKEV